MSALKRAIGEARGSIEALLDLLNQHREPLGSDGATLCEQGVSLTACDEQTCADRCSIHVRECNALREHELLEGVELVAQLLDRVEVGIRHGLFSCAGDEEGSANRKDHHCLRGDSVKTRLMHRKTMHELAARIHEFFALNRVSITGASLAHLLKVQEDELFYEALEHCYIRPVLAKDPAGSSKAAFYVAGRANP